MRFVAYDQIEHRPGLLLRGSDLVERLICGEHHRGSPVAGRISEGLGDTVRVGSDRNRQLRQIGRLVTTTLPRSPIGTHTHICLDSAPLRRPFPHRLPQQRDRRDYIQHRPIGGHSLFGDPERDHGFACPARKDHLPPGSTSVETGHHSVDGVLLVGVRLVQHPGNRGAIGISKRVRSREPATAPSRHDTGHGIPPPSVSSPRPG